MDRSTMDPAKLVVLAEIPVSLKLTNTLALMVLSIGYLFAMIQTFNSHAMNDGVAMLSVQDLVIAYSGDHSKTRLEGAIKGQMSGMLDDSDRASIIAWIGNKAPRDEFDETISPILAKQCLACHDGANPHIPNLDGFDNVLGFVEIDEGMDVMTLIRVSHIHLFGITFIFYILSTVFSRAYMKHVWFKRTVLAVPFLAIMVDIFSWYLTKLYPPFAVVIFVSGGLMGVCFLIQWTVSMYQMWFYKSPVHELS